MVPRGTICGYVPILYAFIAILAFVELISPFLIIYFRCFYLNQNPMKPKKKL